MNLYETINRFSVVTRKRRSSDALFMVYRQILRKEELFEVPRGSERELYWTSDPREIGGNPTIHIRSDRANAFQSVEENGGRKKKIFKVGCSDALFRNNQTRSTIKYHPYFVWGEVKKIPLSYFCVSKDEHFNSQQPNDNDKRNLKGYFGCFFIVALGPCWGWVSERMTIQHNTTTQFTLLYHGWLTDWRLTDSELQSQHIQSIHRSIASHF